MLNTPTVLEVPAFDEHIRYGGCMQRSTSLALRAEGVEPPQLLGKYWRFIREWGPPFRNKSSFAISDGAFHVFASKFDDSREALSRHGIDVVMCRGMDPVESWNRILERLARGRPTPILLDNYHLKIHETFYQKIHGTHVFAVGGYDPEARQVHVFNVRESVEDWQVPFETVLEAWATEEYTWFDVLMPPELRPGLVISGSSPAGLAAAHELGATPVKYPKPPGEEDWAGEDVGFGVRVGIVARESADEAWQVAVERFPETREGKIAWSCYLSDGEVNLALLQ